MVIAVVVVEILDADVETDAVVVVVDEVAVAHRIELMTALRLRSGQL